MSDDLKPCPFCGCDAKVSFLDYKNGSSDARMIRCSSDGSCSTLEEQTVEVWNSRPTEDRLRAELYDIKKMECPVCQAIAPENEKDWPDTECVVCAYREEIVRLEAELDAAREAINTVPLECDGSDCPTDRSLDWLDLPAVWAACEGKR